MQKITFGGFGFLGSQVCWLSTALLALNYFRMVTFNLNPENQVGNYFYFVSCKMVHNVGKYEHLYMSKLCFCPYKQRLFNHFFLMLKALFIHSF